MRRRLLAGVVAAMLGSVGLAACSSSGSNGGSGGNGGSGSAKSVLEIGIITPNQSQTVSLPWLFQGAQAAVDEINAAGGVNGHQLKLNTCNGAFDPNTEVRCAQQAVQGKDVAMVGQLIADGGQVDPLFTKAQLANVGVSAISPTDAQEKSSFVLDPTVLGYMAFAPTLKRELHVTKIAVLNSDSSAYDTSVAVERLGAQTAGVQIVKEIRVPTNATDMSLYIAQAKAAGAQAMGVNLIQTQVLATWKALAASHSPLKFVVDATSVSNNLKQAGPAANGSYGISSTPAGDDSNQWGKAYVAAMKKYQPGKTPVSGGMSAYEAVNLFATAAKNIKGDITRQSVWQAMNNFSAPFAWFDHLDYTKPGPMAGYPRIGAIMTYPGVIKNEKFVSLPPFDPTQSQ